MKAPMASLRSVAVALIALGSLGACAVPYHELLRGSARLAAQEFGLPAADPGLRLHVRNKRLESLATFTPDNIVLLARGGTVPAERARGPALDESAWMDYIARRGYDVYLAEVRGEGASAGAAAREVSAAVDFILERRAVDKLMLIGWSRGAAVMASYAARNEHRVRRLVLVAPLWPAGEPLYDPADIRAPTLLIAGERDADGPAAMAQTLFPLLVNAAPRRLIVLGDGAHPMHAENSRLHLFREVQLFLDDARR
jgi:pimeloyl-ACP methyl ester carboxylesterase